ncbi:hypothetical protein ACFL1I_06870 [Candidatus Omnitrophota bacterium]
MPASWNKKYKIGILAAILCVIVAYIPTAEASTRMLQTVTEDGVLFRVYFEKGIGPEQYYYAYEVLQASKAAYRKVVSEYGFNRKGYTFSQPTNLFAYDIDKVIDVYISDVPAPYALMTPAGGLEYKAQIYVPQDFRAYRQRYNITQPELELAASLTHELLHIVTFSYNRNMQASWQGKTSLTSHRWDWYTEGLARYFEALAGYQEEFLSSGYRKKRGDKIEVLPCQLACILRL